MFICCFLLFAVAVAGPCTWHLAAWKTSLSFHMSSTFVWRGCALCFLCLENSSWLPAAIDFQPRWEWTEFDARSVWYMFGIKDKNIICHIYIYLHVYSSQRVDWNSEFCTCLHIYVHFCIFKFAHFRTSLHVFAHSTHFRISSHIPARFELAEFHTFLHIVMTCKEPPKKKV